MKSEFVRAMDLGSKGYKIFMAFPLLDTSWGIYRIKKSSDNMSTGQAMLGALLLVIGIPFMWLVDIISIACKGHIIWFKDPIEEPGDIPPEFKGKI